MSPSDVTTPFSRRFTDEGRRALEETRTLYDAVTRRHKLSIWGKSDSIEGISKAALKIIREETHLPGVIIDSVDQFQRSVLSLESTIFTPIEYDFSQPITLREQKELNDRLKQQQAFLDDEDSRSDLILDVFQRVAQSLSEALPTPQPSRLTVPLLSILRDPASLIESLIFTFYQDGHRDAELFSSLNTAVYFNLCRASRISPAEGTVKPLIYPTKAKLRPKELVETYLGGTPLHALFYAPFPFELRQEQRFAGHWCIAPPGRGKTILLQAMVCDDINRDAAIVLFDSKGDLIEPFRNMRSIAGRLIVIEPEIPIAINPLDIPKTEIGKTVELLEYLFASLLEFELTPTQSLLLRNVIRFLVTQFKTPTLEMFREVLSDGWEKYRGPIGRLDPHLRDYFYKEFNNEDIVARRREVLRRLDLLLDNDAMRAMLSSPSTRFTFDDALDSGKIVIINNSKDKLGDHGAEFFARFFIAQLLATAQRRSGRPQHKKKPVFCYIDECQNVIARDEKISTILDECRSQNIGLILSHQRTTQIKDENVLSALSNCAIRFANSDAEARKLAPSLRTSQEFLESLQRGTFAAYIRDCTRTAIAIDVAKPYFPPDDKLSPEEQKRLREAMIKEYGREAPARNPVTQVSPKESPRVAPKKKKRWDPLP